MPNDVLIKIFATLVAISRPHSTEIAISSSNRRTGLDNRSEHVGVVFDDRRDVATQRADVASDRLVARADSRTGAHGPETDCILRLVHIVTG